MLTALYIENFAIVKQLELDLSQGMTAFTGETGAGKSIMIDALMLALGEKGDASVIRKGEERCDIHAVFRIDAQSEPALWLAEQEMAWNDGEIILRRVFYLEGRSKSFINGQPCPLPKIRELSEMLVHIHGQHQHQALIQHASHRKQLDHYARHESLLHQVALDYKSCQRLKAELTALQNQEVLKDRLALLQFQVEELASLQLREGEIQDLNEEHQRLHHANDYLQSIQQMSELLGADDRPNIRQQLHQILRLLEDLPAKNTCIQNALELIKNALIQCEEAENEILSFGQQVELDPQRLSEVELRLTTIHKVARKNHVDPSQLLLQAQSLEQELTSLQNRDLRLLQLEQDYERQRQTYEKSALLLSKSRKQHAEKLGLEISAIIQQLGMPKGHVTLEISPLEQGQSHGLDKVEYQVALNPGMPADSLSKIASGGELSRISLAIQMITAKNGATPTLIFDEVDVGIGGATAALVGQLLARLGHRLQVFCVTHQAQVAACAEHHFVVEKFSNNEETFSSIVQVKDHEKIDEIARMLGGLVITEQTRSHAKELLLSNVE